MINQELFEKKYQDENETYKEMCYRVADNDEQAEMMLQGMWLPAGRQLRGKNTDSIRTLFNCYGLDFENVNGKGRDSRQAINLLEGRSDEIAARGGGVGYNFSTLRPKDALLSTLSGGSSGSVSFMERISFSQSVISASAERRSALIGILDIWHPDIIDFIHAKKDLTKMNNMNISIMISDNFIKAVKKDLDWHLVFPDYKKHKKEYDAEWTGDLNKWEHGVEVYQTVKARYLWGLILEQSWETGEPGVLFSTNINKVNNFKEKVMIRVCNPCGEQQLAPNSSCNLGSINLLSIYNPDYYENIDWNLLEKSIKHSIDYLDNAIDEEKYFDDIIERNQKYYRQVGLGVMGYADLLIVKGLVYGSEKALKFTDVLGKFILDKAYKYSALLAKEKGKAPVYDDVKLTKYYLNKCSDATKILVKTYGLRNSTVLSIAPTGSIAMLLGVNGGIEPYFAFEYTRDDVMGKRVVTADIVGFARSEECLATSQQIGWKEHIKTQAKWQEYIDSSISKTINLPNDATKEDIGDAFMLAHSMGIKGTTIYRDGSRSGVLNVIKPILKSEAKLPDEIFAVRKKIKVKGKNFYFVTGYDSNSLENPVELFIITNKSVSNDVTGDILNSLQLLAIKSEIKTEIIQLIVDKIETKKNIDKIARYISMLLRHNVPIKDIVDIMLEGHEVVGSLIYQITKHLMSLITNRVESRYDCPECGEKLIHSEGCLICNCGYSKC